jgi:hypothetical protein
METAELEWTTDVLRRVPAAVAGWSDGLAALEPFDIEVVDRPIESLSDAGAGRLWAGPADCRPELDRLVRRGRYDAVLAVWPTPGTLELCGWGCSIGPSHAAHGAGFSSIVSDHWRSYATQPHPE